MHTYNNSTTTVVLHRRGHNYTLLSDIAKLWMNADEDRIKSWKTWEVKRTNSVKAPPLHLYESRGQQISLRRCPSFSFSLIGSLIYVSINYVTDVQMGDSIAQDCELKIKTKQKTNLIQFNNLLAVMDPETCYDWQQR